MKLKINNGQTLPVIQYLQKLPAGDYDVTIEKRKHSRSTSQNALMWMWLTCIADETGADKSEIHDEFRRMFLPAEVVRGLHGEMIERPVSTTKLSSAQFTEYLNKIEVFASAELGIVLPRPDDLVFEAFSEQYKNRL